MHIAERQSPLGGPGARSGVASSKSNLGPFGFNLRTLSASVRNTHAFCFPPSAFRRGRVSKGTMVWDFFQKRCEEYDRLFRNVPIGLRTDKFGGLGQFHQARTQ